MKPKVKRIVVKKIVKKFLTISAVVVLLLAVISGVWLVYFSDYLTIKEIRVEGNKVIASEQITEAAKIPMGLQLARLDIDKTAQGVAGLKPVASVTVKRNWPHAVVISITERKAILAVASSQGYLNIDKEGIAFTLTKDLPKGILLIESKKPSESLIKSVTLAWLAFPEEIKPKVQKIEASALDDITFVLKDETKVFWGSGEKSEEKSQVLQALYKIKAKLYDVSAPDHPITK